MDEGKLLQEVTTTKSTRNGGIHWWTNFSTKYKSTDICIKSKAAMLTLFWCFCIGIIYGIASNPSKFIVQSIGLGYSSLIYFLNAVSLCFYPLAGYFADNVYSRYKIIVGSLKLLLIENVLNLIPFAVGIALVSTVFKVSQYAISVVTIIFYIVMNVSSIGFNTNIIQFGMEQLYDSPADHQSLFIYWYVWIYYLVQVIIVQPWNLISIDNFNTTYVDEGNFTLSDRLLTAIPLFFMLLFLSLIMIAISLCVLNRKTNWFLINPATINPYKLVRKITRFARQHKVPVYRSAFTYCEDEIPTGLDLAKDKYGGPYTTEEVENVKAFYGIRKILLSLGPVFFFTYAAEPAQYWYIRNILQDQSGQFYHYVLDDNTLSSLVVVVIIPIYLAIVRVCRCRHYPNMLQRIGLGIFFLILTLISTMASIIPLRLKGQECTVTDYYEDDLKEYTYRFPFEALLPVIPRFLHGISNLFLYPALYEFICAQSPPSMKGLLIGLSFAIRGIFQAIGAVLVIPFYNFTTNLFYDCGLWYYGLSIPPAILTLILFTYYARKYKYRQRDDICDIYHYAEEYYSNMQEEENYD